MAGTNPSGLDQVILNFLSLGCRYDDRTGLLRYRTWGPIAHHLNSMGYSTPTEQKPWTAKSLANYYRRHLQDRDGRLQASKRQASKWQAASRR